MPTKSFVTTLSLPIYRSISGLESFIAVRIPGVYFQLESPYKLRRLLFFILFLFLNTYRSFVPPHIRLCYFTRNRHANQSLSGCRCRLIFLLLFSLLLEDVFGIKCRLRHLQVFDFLIIAEIFLRSASTAFLVRDFSNFNRASTRNEINVQRRCDGSIYTESN